MNGQKRGEAALIGGVKHKPDYEDVSPIERIITQSSSFVNFSVCVAVEG